MQIIRKLAKYKFLIEQLVIRDFKVKYKRSVLGMAWSLLHPVLMTVVMYIVFSSFFRFSAPGVSYPAYLLSGMLFFNYFSEASNLSMSTIVANAGLINKVYVPKYIFPLTKCMFVGINFALSLIPLYVVLIVTGTGVCWQHIFLLYAFGCLFLFTLGAGLLLATITVYLRDMFYIYSIILQILSYMTPIFWHPTIIGSPTILAILKLNPLYHIIDFARTILLYQQTPTALQFGLCLLFGLVILGIGSFVFKKYQNEFIYHI